MKRLLTLIAAMLGIASQGAMAQSSAAAPQEACRTPGRAIDESGFVEIGGIRQWVVIQGRDCANPVVLLVHGGPGNPTTPFATRLFGEWAKEFTIVQWDQRGAGKTYAANTPGEDEPLTMARLRDDGVEIARYAAGRLAKRKVILMGGSWGSALAVHMAMAAPDRFHAYVGTAQLSDFNAALKSSYATSLSLARTAGDADAVDKLEQIGSPPWTDPRSFGVLRRIARKYEAKATDPSPEGWFAFAPGYDAPDYLAAYEAGEDYSFLQFVGRAGDGIGPKIKLLELGERFAIPVYLLQGEQDLLTPLAVNRTYFEKIGAPTKEFIVIPRAGHDPNAATMDEQLKVLRKIRPGAMKADAG